MSANPQSVEAEQPLEIWAGVECTINRVGDTFIDQLERVGHLTREDDIDVIAELGFRRLRFPVQWERVAPDGLASARWEWSDRGLERLAGLGIQPIVGLLHHGSSPAYTSLADPAFPDKFSDFAHAVARRYPWVADYVPINEPVTTARFSGLYGHWYPHGRDNVTFLRLLLNQCKATALAMQAIRGVNPKARLIQTDDLVHTNAGVELLGYQSAYENDRCFLGFDLLLGRVTPEHGLWRHLLENGNSTGDLEWFVANPCPPDIVGVNYYITSERYLDDRLHHYPAHLHGGNHRHRYVDVEAVRVPGGMVGPYTLFQRLWERFRIPIAITEIQNNCTREEQLRWLMEMRNTALELRRDGVDVRAISLWSLLGTYDWHNLVTRTEDRYEIGVFDIRGPRLRPTALARAARDLLSGVEPNHPVLATPGWWNRPARVLFPNGDPYTEYVSPQTRGHDPAARPILLVGYPGGLTATTAALCELRGLPHTPMLPSEAQELASVEAAIERLNPWAVIFADEPGFDFHRTADTNDEPDLAETVAVACRQWIVQLLYFSNDLVFDGRQREPYVESSPVSPASRAGRSKAYAERLVLYHLPTALIIRHSLLFGCVDGRDRPTRLLKELAAGCTPPIRDDTVYSPTFAPELVHAALDLLIDGEAGIWHLANSGKADMVELLRRAVGMAGVQTAGDLLPPANAGGHGAPWKLLRSERGELLGSLEEALARYVSGVRFECSAAPV